MGKYINEINGKPIGSSYHDKCRSLLANGATRVSDVEFKPNMVCVVDNGFFAAAGYAYCEDEYEEFKAPCGRPKTWFTIENAAELAQ